MEKEEGEEEEEGQEHEEAAGTLLESMSSTRPVRQLPKSVTMVTRSARWAGRALAREVLVKLFRIR